MKFYILQIFSKDVKDKKNNLHAAKIYYYNCLIIILLLVY